ncbi:MAG: hypothetical protein ACYTHM_21370 [Planctomycetota bacterium]|jgi:hypothetical protein
MKRGRALHGVYTSAAILAFGALLTFLFHAVKSPNLKPAHRFSKEIEGLTGRVYTRPVLRGEKILGNAADAYRRAERNLMTGGGEEIARALFTGTRPPREEYEIWLSVNRDVVAAVRKGTRCFCSFLLLDPACGYEADAPEVGMSLPLAALVIETGLRTSEKGRWREGAEMILDAARFGQDLARGGGVMHRVFAVEVEVLALKWFLRLLGKPSGSASDLRSLLREVERLEAGHHPLSETLDGEAAFLLGDLGRGERGGELRVGGHAWRPGSSADIDRAAQGVLDWLASVKNTGKGSEGAARDRSAGAPAVKGGAAGDPVGSWIPDLEFLADVERRVFTLRSMVRIALALHMHRRAYGAFPETLSVLTPSVLDPLPLDRLARGPFRYTRTAAGGAVIRSAGPDGDEDSDKIAPVDLSPDSDGDWVFRLEP